MTLTLLMSQVLPEVGVPSAATLPPRREPGTPPKSVTSKCIMVTASRIWLVLFACKVPYNCCLLMQPDHR